MLKVAKFGGSSLADSQCFLRAAKLIRDDPARRVVVVSAAGKRRPGDAKITDLLYLCNTHLTCGVSCWDLFRRIRERYMEIRDGCGLSLALDEEFEAVYNSLSVSPDLAASRGEYLSARLMAALLDYQFCDAALWLRFGHDGQVDHAASRKALRELAEDRPVVLPGFYGTGADGQVRVFSRGGSDVTGALAAAFLDADLYENWTDVPGVLSADPRVTDLAQPVPSLRYEQLQFLTAAGLQVLHPDAVEPVARQSIPLRICSTRQPELPGTVISAEGMSERLATAGRKGLRVEGVPGAVALGAAVFPEGWWPRLKKGLEQVDHVVVSQTEESVRFLTGSKDLAAAVELLHKAADGI